MITYCSFILLALTTISSSLKAGSVPVSSPPPQQINHATFVAFSVGKTKHQLGAGRVTYDRIFLNVGGGFVAAHNIFVAPIGGIYSFHFHGLNHIQGTTKTELFLDLFKNNEYLVSMYESSERYGGGGNGVLLQLVGGDQVDVRNRNSDSGLYGSVDQVYATFSGYLVVPIYKVTTFIGGGIEPAQHL